MAHIASPALNDTELAERKDEIRGNLRTNPKHKARLDSSHVVARVKRTIEHLKSLQNIKDKRRDSPKNKELRNAAAARIEELQQALNAYDGGAANADTIETLTSAEGGATERRALEKQAQKMLRRFTADLKYFKAAQHDNEINYCISEIDLLKKVIHYLKDPKEAVSRPADPDTAQILSKLIQDDNRKQTGKLRESLERKLAKVVRTFYIYNLPDANAELASSKGRNEVNAIGRAYVKSFKSGCTTTGVDLSKKVAGTNRAKRAGEPLSKADEALFKKFVGLDKALVTRTIAALNGITIRTAAQEAKLQRLKTVESQYSHRGEIEELLRKLENGDTLTAADEQRVADLLVDDHDLVAECRPPRSSTDIINDLSRTQCDSLASKQIGDSYERRVKLMEDIAKIRKGNAVGAPGANGQINPTDGAIQQRAQEAEIARRAMGLQ